MKTYDFTQFAKTVVRYFQYENYCRKLSDRKLLKVAHRVLWPQIRMYHLDEAIYEEMVKRIEQSAKDREMVIKIQKELK